MVKSNLVKSVNYPEIKTLDEEDKNHDADMYELQILGVDCIIALGTAKFAFIDQDIVYYPVYLIRNDRVDSQIGLYEIMKNKQVSVLDEDGDIDIERLGPLLLYSYVNSEYLKEQEEEPAEKTAPPTQDADGAPDDEESEEEEEEEEGDEEDEEEEGDEDEEGQSFSPLKGQDAEQAIKERKAYKKTKNEPWVQTFMTNKNYSIKDNEGGGDCLFASIRDGLSRVGINTTVTALRDQLAEEATQDVFEGYRVMYETTQAEIAAVDADMKAMTKEFKEITKRGKQTRDREVLKQLTVEAKKIKDNHNRAKREKRNAKLLAAEYAFMKGITDLEKFKAVVRTCNFWGETWAISTLERVLNVKLIIFSREAFRDKDLDNVLLCGQLNDAVLEENGIFTPRYYLMVEYLGAHYTLVTYKDRGAFTFNEIPYDLRVKIVERCLERAAGPFYIIPEFRTFMESIHIEPPLPQDDDTPQGDVTSDLFDENIVFQFYSKSANAPRPGKGSGEKIRPEDELKFGELATIPEWRRKLSNFWVAPFDLDGHRWSSVEHYYQASKFKENNPQFYLQFTLDANPQGELAKDPALAKAAGGKTGKFKGKRVREAEIVIDPNFFNGRHKSEMKAAQMAKFSQNAELKEMLLATKMAKLQHFVRASPPVVFMDLMEVRRELGKSSK